MPRAQRRGAPRTAASLVRSAIDPRDIDAPGLLRSARRMHPDPAGFGKIAVTRSLGQRGAIKLPVKPARAGRRRSRRGPAMRGSGSGQWQGRVRKSPAGVTNSARPPISAALIGLRAAARGSRASSAVDLLLALLRLERAGAVDDPCRPASSARRRGRAGGAAGRRAAAMSASRLSQATSGMAADRAGRRAGRVEQHGVERPGLPFGRVGRDRFGGERRAARDCRARRASRSAERSTAVTLRAGGASCAVLPPGAAHRSATRLAARHRRAAAPAARRRRPAPTRRPRR